jgi:hypothetical protein
MSLVWKDDQRFVASPRAMELLRGYREPELRARFHRYMVPAAFRIAPEQPIKVKVPLRVVSLFMAIVLPVELMLGV